MMDAQLRAITLLQNCQLLDAIMNNAFHKVSGYVCDIKMNQPCLPKGTTTLMVRNLPRRYTVRDLLLEWKPDGSFDMLHVPMDPDLCYSKGYCFVNFISPEAAVAFHARVHKTRLKFQKGKTLNISAAWLQGRQKNLEHFKHKMQFYVPSSVAFPALFQGSEPLCEAEVRRIIAASSCKQHRQDLRHQHRQHEAARAVQIVRLSF
jgi:hypothetical protein